MTSKARTEASHTQLQHEFPREDFDLLEYKSDVPEGVSGKWAVEKFTVTPAQALRYNVLHSGGRYVSPGDYTRLVYGKRQEVVMSDTPAELLEHHEPVDWAFGRCLVNGLGLGVVVDAMLLRGFVEHVTVVELEADVIALTAGHLREKWGDRVEIVQADALAYQPPRGVRYEYVWHDIWPTISSSNLPDMIKLHRRYGRRCSQQGSWARDQCEYMRREEAKDVHLSLASRFYG